MLEFPVLPVSVKSKMTIWIKGDSLSFGGWWIYKSALKGPFDVAWASEKRIGTTSGS